MNTLTNKTIIICSIVRDAEKGLKRNIPVINQLCTYFLDYKIIIYENDSTDNTKKVLTEWKNSDSKHIYVSLNDCDKSQTIPNHSETKCNPFFSNKRINKMAQLRNFYMNYIEENNWSADYLMVADLDVSQLYLKGIISALSKDIKWDAITAFGYSASPSFKRRYHDSYALVEIDKATTPQTENSISSLQKKYGNLKDYDKWIKVYSAFGGLSIYKFDAIKHLKYKVITNNDSRVEVRCEHFSIYEQMHEYGYNDIYIVPEMKLKYQTISLQLIWNTLKRKLRTLLEKIK